MTQTQTWRSIPLVAIAFALAGWVMVTVKPLGHPPVTVGSAESSPATAAASAGDFPDVAIETADGTRTSFAATGGHIRIATMFYAHCPGVCPITIDALRGIEGQLTAAERAKLNVILLSLDPTRDSPQALRAFAQERAISSPRWVLGRTSQADAGTFARAAHIDYRTLSDGSLDHSTALVLLDAQGRVLARTSDTSQVTEFVAALRQALDATGTY
jgi:protein SCO1